LREGVEGVTRENVGLGIAVKVGWTIAGAACTTDLDKDEDPDIADLLFVLGSFGKDALGDSDADGDTDLDDLMRVLGEFGNPCP